MRKKQKSPALQLVELVYENADHGRGRSRERFEGTMADAIGLAVEGGLRFDLEDFKTIAEQRSESYHNTSLMQCPGGAIEPFYSVAAGSKRGRENKSAALSYEHWKGRKPFLVRESPDIQTPTRVYVGFRFRWYGELITCTSIDDEKKVLVACSYKPQVIDEDGYCGPAKIDKRHTINHDDIRDYHETLKAWASIKDDMRKLEDDKRNALTMWAEETFGKDATEAAMRLNQVKEVRAKLDEFAVVAA